jgi:hypothetical protein
LPNFVTTIRCGVILARYCQFDNILWAELIASLAAGASAVPCYWRWLRRYLHQRLLLVLFLPLFLPVFSLLVWLRPHRVWLVTSIGFGFGCVRGRFFSRLFSTAISFSLLSSILAGLHFASSA